MAGFTPNYRLHQWEPTDSFLRTDFNQDFSTIDAALGRAERSAEANAYNVYNLMLQNDYEGKYTGYKKALIFDGFLDESGIAEKSECLICSDGAVYLERTGQGDITIPGSGNYTSIFSAVQFPEQIISSTGYLTGLTVHTGELTGGNPQPFTADVTCIVSRNGHVVFQDMLSLFCTVAGGQQTMSLPESIPVGPGDSLSIQLQSNSGELRLPYQAGKLCGILRITPANGTEGSLVSHDTMLPTRNRILAWVRHSGGTVGVTILDGDEEYPLSCTGTVETENLQGQPCTESAFLLSDVPMGDMLSIRLELAISESENASLIYDYGVVVL